MADAHSPKMRRVQLSELRQMVREELLREWQDAPQSFQEFAKQHKVAAKDIYPGIDRVLMSYQETAEASDTKELAQDILVAVMGLIYDKLEARLGSGSSAKSGMRQKVAA